MDLKKVKRIHFIISEKLDEEKIDLEIKSYYYNNLEIKLIVLDISIDI